jgi:hypothetical protein
LLIIDREYASKLGMVAPQGAGSLLIVVFGIVSSFCIILVFNIENTIFNTARYVYADKDAGSVEFTVGVLANAFKAKSSNF